MNKQRLTAALDLIGVLAERFPACFAVNPSYRRPLKLGIHLDILAQLSDTIAPRDLSAALRIYVSNVKYLKALVAGADRVDLNGMPAGTVTAEHADMLKLNTSSGATNRRPSRSSSLLRRPNQDSHPNPSRLHPSQAWPT